MESATSCCLTVICTETKLNWQQWMAITHTPNWQLQHPSCTFKSFQDWNFHIHTFSLEVSPPLHRKHLNVLINAQEHQYTRSLRAIWREGKKLHTFNLHCCILSYFLQWLISLTLCWTADIKNTFQLLCFNVNHYSGKHFYINPSHSYVDMTVFCIMLAQVWTPCS